MKNDKEYKGKRVVTVMTAELSDNGLWTVQQEIIQGRKKELSDKWEEAKGLANATDSDLNNAIKDVTLTLMTYLKAVEGDLFNQYKETDVQDTN